MEKRVLYGLAVLLMYLVDSGFCQGEVKLTIDEATWKQLLINAQLPIVLTLTSSLCGVPCAILEDQVARLAETYGERVIFYIADILENPFFAKLYKVRNVPIVIVFEDGEEQNEYGDVELFVKATQDFETFKALSEIVTSPSHSAPPSPSPSARPCLTC